MLYKLAPLLFRATQGHCTPSEATTTGLRNQLLTQIPQVNMHFLTFMKISLKGYRTDLYLTCLLCLNAVETKWNMAINHFNCCYFKSPLISMISSHGRQQFLPIPASMFDMMINVQYLCPKLKKSHIMVNEKHMLFVCFGIFKSEY